MYLWKFNMYDKLAPQHKGEVVGFSGGGTGNASSNKAKPLYYTMYKREIQMD